MIRTTSLAVAAICPALILCSTPSVLTSESAPEPTESWPLKINRSFSFNFDVGPPTSAERAEAFGGANRHFIVDWDLEKTLRTTDLISGFGENADFERTMHLTWQGEMTSLNTPDDDWLVHGLLKPLEQSPLVGRSLDFQFDRATGWQASLRNPMQDEATDLCSGLRADMNLTALQPPAGTRTGGVWVVKDGLLRDIFLPGGDLRLQFHRKGFARMGIDEFERTETMLALFEDPIGSIELTAQPGGRFLAKLDVTFEQVPKPDQPGEMPMGKHFSKQSIEFKAEGSGAWDSEAGFVSYLDLEGTATIVLTSGGEDRGSDELRFPGRFVLKLTNARN